MPTSEWKAATSCGSEVIWMRFATTAPIAAADGDAGQDQHDAAAVHARAQQRRHDGDRHADHAELVALPRGLGWDSPRSARMNRTAATR